ncbi:MAG: DUF1611 domain-containing protein [archaeon]|nr:DUF1611 domain-containing protein [archaeon]MCP8317046.1 DUF1611 domain-containing protein [archaeon]MCP8320481.1 DUF1611 domain-containing protein [archaeon]
MKKAIILAEGKFKSTDGKTAHGLVRYSKRYKIVGVVDSELSGKDSGEFLDGKPNGIKIYSSIKDALAEHNSDTLIIGIATEGGVLPNFYRDPIKEAIKAGLNIVSGLHEFLSDDPEFRKLARENDVEIIDVRKIFYKRRIFFTGRIDKVGSIKLAVLGTDACIGKRTTTILLTEAFNDMGLKSVFIGTGQTAWMQGAKYCTVLDSVINDFVAGDIEHEIWRAYQREKPDIMIIEGQGSLVHPAFPGSFEIVAAGRPDAIILQHAPKRKCLDGFPQYPMPDLERVIRIIELISLKKIVAITLNHESMSMSEIEEAVRNYEENYGVAVCDPLIHGVNKVANRIMELFPRLKKRFESHES